MSNIKSILLLLFIFSISACSANKATIEQDNLANNLSVEHLSLVNHLKTLSSDQFSGRKINSKGNKQAQIYIRNSLSNSGVSPFQASYYHPFVKHKSFSQIKGTNIIGVVKGKKYPDKYIVLSAHFDHLGVKGGVIYNGADDNASGTAALLYFAEEIQQQPLSHSVIFLFTDGEESGLYGSKAFIKQQPDLLANISLNINIDMISGYSRTKTLHYIEKNLLNLLGQKNYQLFKQQNDVKLKTRIGFRQVNQGGLFMGHKINYTKASDQYAFHKANIPFIYYGVGEHPNYHSPNDDFAHANLAFFMKASDFILQKILFIDQGVQ